MNKYETPGRVASPVQPIVIPFDLFLSSDNDNLTEPFSDGKYTYYSNGHICLRIPYDHSVAKQPPYNINVLPWPSGMIPPLVEFKNPRIKKEKCHYCKGSGEVCICPDCAGDGYVQWNVGRHEYEADCLECEGSGFVNSGNGEQCDNCAGKGYVDKIEAVHLDDDLALTNIVLSKLAQLPSCKISSKRISQYAFYFMFDGGDGIAMGMVI